MIECTGAVQRAIGEVMRTHTDVATSRRHGAGPRAPGTIHKIRYTPDILMAGYISTRDKIGKFLTLRFCMRPEALNR